MSDTSALSWRRSFSQRFSTASDQRLGVENRSLLYSAWLRMWELSFEAPFELCLRRTLDKAKSNAPACCVKGMKPTLTSCCRRRESATKGGISSTTGIYSLGVIHGGLFIAPSVQCLNDSPKLAERRRAMVRAIDAIRCHKTDQLGLPMNSLNHLPS